MPSGIGALSSLCQTENELPSGYFAAANQPMLGTGILSSVLPPSSPMRLELGIDVVDLEVDGDALLAFPRRIDRASGLALEHVVLGRALLILGVVLELPAGQLAPELHRPAGVVCRDLDVNDLALHVSPFLDFGFP